MNSDRFRFFSSVHQESDLLIGVSHQSYHYRLENLCSRIQYELYVLISDHIKLYPAFAKSLTPLAFPGKARDLNKSIEIMYKCGYKTGTGPMSSVAGLFAEKVGQSILAEGNVISGDTEVIVENGGDLYVRNRADMVVRVHAGEVDLSGRLALVLPPGEWGVCTSSGTLGHSLSLGKADAVTVVSHSTPLADAWATALANRVKGREDIPSLLERVDQISDIKACVAIAGGELGIRSEIETKLLP